MPKMVGGGRVRRRTVGRVLRLSLTVLLLFGCNNFSVTGLLDTPPSTAPSTLKLVPQTVNVLLGGTQQFTATGGSGGYTYSVVPGGAGGTVDTNGLYRALGTTGSDSVIVTDSSGAISEATAQVVNSISLSISPTSTVVNAGSAAVLYASGGTPPYSWSKVSGAGSLSGGGASATYTAPWASETAQIKVTDSALASMTATVNVNAPPPVQISPTAPTVSAHGSVTFTASGGSGSYTWSLAGPGSLVGSTYTAPWAAGAATVTATDNNTSGTSQATVTITAAPPLTITPSTIDVTVGDPVTFTGSGGSGSYSFSVVSGSGTLVGATYTTVAPETADIRMSDTNGAASPVDATVNVSPATGVLEISPTSTTVNAGSAAVLSASGGTPPYTWTKLSGAGSLSPLSGSPVTYTAPWTAETAQIKVTDSALASVTATVTVSAPVPVQISPTAPTVSAHGSVSFTATGGSGSYTWSLAGPGSLVGSTYTAPWTSGTATVTVTDTNVPGPSGTSHATVTITPAPPLTITPSTVSVTVGNAVTFTGSGGSGSYSFSVVTGSGTLVGATYTPLVAETADIRMSDTNGAASPVDATVNSYLPLTLVPATVTVQTNGTYPFTATGGKTPYVFSMVSGAGSIVGGTGVYSAPGAPGTDIVEVTDALNNTSTATVTVQSPPPGWNIVSVDASSKSGQYASLALNSSGQPRIAYYESQAKELRLATYNGSSWSVGTVDTAGRVGQYASLALTQTGMPRISYYDSQSRQLDYAVWNGSGWTSPQVVDSAGRVGQYTSLALDPSGNPRISYYDESNDRLKFASWNGSSWNVQAVNGSNAGGEYTSLRLDPSTGYALISFYDSSRHLSLARQTGPSAWNIQTVPDDDGSSNYGVSSSLVLDSSRNPRISYYDVQHKKLNYAAWNGSSWSVETIPDIDGSSDYGSYSSLALDLAGNPRISYYDMHNRDLKFASWNGTWSVTAVDTGNNIGQYNSLALDPFTSAPRIAYYDQTAQDLKFASQ